MASVDKLDPVSGLPACQGVTEISSSAFLLTINIQVGKQKEKSLTENVPTKTR